MTQRHFMPSEMRVFGEVFQALMASLPQEIGCGPRMAMVAIAAFEGRFIDGYAAPSVAAIAREAGMSVRSVQNHLNTLHRLERVATIPNFGKTSTYATNFPEKPPPFARRSAKSAPPADSADDHKPAQQGSQTETAKAKAAAAQSPNPPSQNEPNPQRKLRLVPSPPAADTPPPQDDRLLSKRIERVLTENQQAPASQSRRGSTTVQTSGADETSGALLASAVDEGQCSTDPRIDSDSRSRLKVPARSSSAAPSAETAHRKEGPTWNQPSGCAKAGGGTAFGEGPALADPLIREASFSRDSAGRGVVTSLGIPASPDSPTDTRPKGPSEVKGRILELVPKPTENGSTDARSCVRTPRVKPSEAPLDLRDSSPPLMSRKLRAALYSLPEGRACYAMLERRVDSADDARKIARRVVQYGRKLRSQGRELDSALRFACLVLQDVRDYRDLLKEAAAAERHDGPIDPDEGIFGKPVGHPRKAQPKPRETFKRTADGSPAAASEPRKPVSPAMRDLFSKFVPTDG